jgi:DNA-binding MarR family transcriptional regulator
MSPVIFRLEQRGLVRRKVLASDRRRHALFFEESAEPIYLAASEKVRTFEGQVAARLTKAEQRELTRLLVKLQGPAQSR